MTISVLNGVKSVNTFYVITSVKAVMRYPTFVPFSLYALLAEMRKIYKEILAKFLGKVRLGPTR